MGKAWKQELEVAAHNRKTESRRAINGGAHLPFSILFSPAPRLASWRHSYLGVLPDQLTRSRNSHRHIQRVAFEVTPDLFKLIMNTSRLLRILMVYVYFSGIVIFLPMTKICPKFETSR